MKNHAKDTARSFFHPAFIIKALILLLYSINLNAASDYYFHQIATEKGLSQSTVNCVMIDHKGLMWIGTASGLNLFDMHEIKSYYQNVNDPNSLPGNHIFFIAEDSLYNIWIGTNNGLARFDKEKHIFTRVVQDSPFYSYTLISKGILFGSQNSLYQFSYSEQTISRLPLKGDTSSKNFQKILCWKKDILLISDRTGTIWTYNQTNKTVEKNTFHNDENRENPSGIACLYIDQKKNLYVCPYQNGIFCYSNEGKKKWHLTSSNSELTNDIILSIQEKDHKLWIATDGGGINILDPDSMTIATLTHVPGDINSLPVNSISCLYKDSKDNIWAGSVRGGVIGIKKVFIKTYKDVALKSTYGLSEKTVISLFEDKDNILWIGTDGGGLNRYDPHKDTFTHYPETYNEKIISITDYSDTELLLCLYNHEPYLFNKKTSKKRLFTIKTDKNINAMFKSPLYVTYANRVTKNKIYLLSNHAYIYDIEKEIFYPFKTNIENLGALSLIGITEDVSYLINNKNIFKVRHQDDSIRVIFTAKGNETIKVACYDNNDGFWIGMDNGLGYYNSQKQTYRKIETPLFNNVSTLLLDHRNRLWIGAQNMLFSYHIKDKKFTIWGESDGFLPNELHFTYYQSNSKKGNIYLGGSGGLVKINNDISNKAESLPQLELLEILVDGTPLPQKQMEISNDIRIPWNYSSLAIKVISHEKDIFRKRVFRYSIKGPENSYIESYNYSINVRGLRPGNYSVYASCNTKNGDWCPEYELLHITVMPPWYSNVWVICGLIIISLSIIYLITRNIIRKKRLRLSLQMKEQIQRVNEERIRFLINISHELRTPLTLICAPLKRLIDSKDHLQENSKEQLSKIYAQACRMKDLINMVLDINKIKEKKNVLHKKSYLVNDWVKTVCEDFRDEFEAKLIKFTYDFSDAIEMVSFDKSKCEIILSNFLTNALKFSKPETEVCIITRMEGEYVRIAIKDQGIGLNNIDIKELFTPFYQGNHDQPGSGIGLAYAKTLINMHGGKIGAFNNEKDRGATFYFDLPLNQEIEAPNEISFFPCDNDYTLSVPKEKEEYDIATENYTILIVEDNTELRTFLKNELWGFKAIYTAINGLEALDVIHNKQPDIIVSDIMMPGLDGYELCKRIKQDINTSHIPIILLTARNDSDSTRIGYSFGADAYISKPFELELLIAVIRNQLNNREIIKQKYMSISYINEIYPQQLNNIDEQFLLKLSKVIHNNLNNPKLDIAFLTDQMAMSRTSLYKKIKVLTGIGANDYINQIRIEKAVELLIHSKLSITEISEECGFSSQRYFSAAFKQIKGITPTQFRESH